MSGIFSIKKHNVTMTTNILFITNTLAIWQDNSYIRDFNILDSSLSLH